MNVISAVDRLTTLAALVVTFERPMSQVRWFSLSRNASKGTRSALAAAPRLERSTCISLTDRRDQAAMGGRRVEADDQGVHGVAAAG